MDSIEKLSKNADIEVYSKNNQWLFINKHLNCWLRTNDSGKGLYDRCDGIKSCEQIIDEVALEYSIDKDIIAKDIISFFQSCFEKNILKGSLDSPLPANSDEHSKNLALENVYVFTSNQCNLDCFYCPSRISQNVKNKHIDLIKISEVLKDIRLTNPTNIILTGGEPLLNPNLLDICRISKESGHRTTIYTNLTIGDEVLYKTLIKYVDRIIISIDSPNEQLNDSIRGAGSLRKMLNNLKLIKELGFDDFGICYSPNKENIEACEDIVEFSLKMRIKELIINRIFPLYDGFDKTKLLEISEFEDLYNRCVEKYIKGMKRRMDDSVTRGVDISWMSMSFLGIASKEVTYEGSKGNSCGLGMSKITIDVDGNLYPCQFLQKPEFIVDNIYEIGFHDAYSRSVSKYKPLYDKSLSECKDCEFDLLCDKGCRASSYYSKGDIQKSDIYCSTIYKSIDNVLFGSPENTIVVE